MATCYHCACTIPQNQGIRRRVFTGESYRFYFTKRGGTSYGQTFGLRTLCPSCAQALDDRQRGSFVRVVIAIAMGLLGAFVTFRIDTHDLGPFLALLWLFFGFGGLGVLTFVLLEAIHVREIDQRAQSSTVTSGGQDASMGDSSTGLPPLLSKLYESDFAAKGENEKEREGLKILYRMCVSQNSFAASGAEWLSNLILVHAKGQEREDAKRFVGLLGRSKEESIDTWFSRVQKLAPYELSTEHANDWLTYVYRLGILLDVPLWFGLDEKEEAEIIEKVHADVAGEKA